MPRSPMTEAEFEKSRGAILKKAAHIVGQSGVGALSMRRLAAALDLTPGALYRYFASKQELLWAFWEDALVDLRTRFAEIDDINEDPVAAIRAMMKTYANFCLADRDRFRLLFLENDEGIPHVVERDAAALAPYAALNRRMEQAAAQNKITTPDTQRSAQMLWGCIHGTVALALTVNEVDFGDVNLLVEETIDTVLRGLSAS